MDKHQPMDIEFISFWLWCKDFVRACQTLFCSCCVLCTNNFVWNIRDFSTPSAHMCIGMSGNCLNFRLRFSQTLRRGGYDSDSWGSVPYDMSSAKSETSSVRIPNNDKYLFAFFVIFFNSFFFKFCSLVFF